ncbi:mannosyltransferase [Seonamhaeicola sediminis]|uniref:Mannosyltransferase n=1 Tax=Seonamhaeicola sediminis TaxID=2528206 RepID=A0A562YFI6_9FLAO|nr:mannosyltransferase [Seonamhaeicola sediminis]TWO33417.1 mannosyltransferase [Seonamhaeicola sediminis]
MQINLSVLKLYKTPILLALTSCVLYVVFAYNLERTQYVKLISLYTALFGLFYWLQKNYKNNTQLLTTIAFMVRAVFILAIPNLSQDFYRFIWDGRVILEGFNPYLHTVTNFIENGVSPVTQADALYKGMGALNASHFTNYPPINQLCFIIAGLFAGKSILGSVVVLRLIIISADFGTLYFGKKLLKKLKLPVHNIFWYVLNPFIIIELTGNLHFEGVMIFFLVWSLYLLEKGKWPWSAVVFALSISTKLMPLMFLPLVYQWFVKKPFEIVQANSVNQPTRNSKDTSTLLKISKLIGFYTIVGGTTLLLFMPFFSMQFVSNYTETVALWFQKFEFNASIYYLLREIGFYIRGYNEIAVLGIALSLIVFLFTMYRTFYKVNYPMENLLKSMVLVFACYLFLSTTVHPWYLATLLFLSVFTKYKFPLVWSFVIILSYLAYIQTGNANKSENLPVIFLEYLTVYGALVWDVFKNNPKATQGNLSCK